MFYKTSKEMMIEQQTEINELIEKRDKILMKVKYIYDRIDEMANKLERIDTMNYNIRANNQKKINEVYEDLKLLKNEIKKEYF